MDPVNELLPPPTSPTISSVSSSDFDTESTGSFFHDRSTTLGTLMGVTFPAITFRAPSRSHSQNRLSQLPTATSAAAQGGGGRKSKRGKKNRPEAGAMEEEERRRWRKKRRWWALCSDECDCRPSSLGDFLEVERRFGDVAIFGGGAAADVQSGNGRLLFADGRVLPPVDVDGSESESPADGLCRFSVSLGGICSGGAL